MSMVSARMSRSGVVMWMLALAGCSAPQFDALKRDLEVDPRERLRAYDSCKARSTTTDDLDRCMKADGYSFVSVADQDYRAGECWNDRYAGKLPKAYCYDPVNATEK